MCYIRVTSQGEGRLLHMFPRVSQGRRMFGITFDWLASYLIALGFFAGSGSFTERVPEARIPVLVIFFAQYAFFVAFGGASFGHRLVGLKVVRFSDGQSATPVQALIRTALLIPIVTAITFDDDGRGINERLSNTVLIQTRNLNS